MKKIVADECYAASALTFSSRL